VFALGEEVVFEALADNFMYVFSSAGSSSSPMTAARPRTCFNPAVRREELAGKVGVVGAGFAGSDAVLP